MKRVKQAKVAESSKFFLKLKPIFTDAPHLLGIPGIPFIEVSHNQEVDFFLQKTIAYY